MRVLHVIPELGGSRRFAIGLAEAQERLGHEVSVVQLVGTVGSPVATIAGPDVAADAEGDVEGHVDVEVDADSDGGVEADVDADASGEVDVRVEVHVDELAGDWRGGVTRAVVKKFRERMRLVDITVAHGPVAGDLVEAAAGRKLPFVYRQQHDTRGWTHRPPRPKKAPAYFRTAAAVVALSAGARRDLIDLLGLPESRMRVVPIGADSRVFRVPGPDEQHLARAWFGFDPDDFVVLTIGALTADSGVGHAIRAVPDMEGVRLLVVGDGPSRSVLERLADGLGRQNVTFAGHLEFPMSAYAAADLVVHPSVSGESMPAVLIEAGLCGLPAVATSIGSVSDVVRSRTTGLLVPPGDLDGLRSAIDTMRHDRVECHLMGDAAREHCAAHFEIEVVAKEWDDVLTSVLRSSS